MDCCNYLEYRTPPHYPYNLNPTHCYQPQYYQQPPYFESTEAFNYDSDYVYNPKEARLRKALREQTRENRSSLSRAHSAALMHQQQQQQHQQQQQQHAAVAAAAAAAQRAGHAQPPSAQPSPHAQQAAGAAWARAAASAAGPFAGAAPAGVARGLRPGPKAMMERSMEEMRSKIREQVEHGLVTNYPEAMVEFEPVPSYSVSQMGMPAGGDYAVVSDIDNQAWYSFAQTSQHAGSSYVMRHSDDKLQSGNWNIHYATDGHAQQGAPYVMRHQMVSSSGPFSTGVNQSILQSTANQGMNRSNPNQQQYQMFTPLPATINQQNNSINQKREVNDDEQIRLMNNIPSSSSNESASTTVTAHQKTIMRNSNNTVVTNSVPHKQTENISNKKQNVPPALSPSTTTADTNVNSDSASESRPLPTFEQAFGSTEIGRYSHEGIFNSSQHNPQDHGSQVSANNSSTNAVWSLSQSTPVTSMNTISTSNPNSISSSLIFSQVPSMYESTYQANYTYYSYMTEYNYSYNHLNSWSGSVRYDDPLNGY